MLKKEDVEILTSGNYQLNFIIGVSGSGKTYQSEEIANEFKYSRINIDEIIKKEIASNSDLGKQVQQIIEQKQKIPKEILGTILVNNIAQSQRKSILIEGFPKNLDEALFFEQNILPIYKIIKLDISYETCLNRLKEHKKDGKINEEEVKKIYDEEVNDINEIDKFYAPYSIIHSVNSEKPIAEVTADMKRHLYPVIYSVIGKRYSGKSRLSKVLQTRMGFDLLDFEKFLNEPEIVKRKTETEFVISQFILKLRKMQYQRILIENFPQNKEQYSYFVNNCRPFEKIIYLNAKNSTCLERLSKLKSDQPNYIDCSKLNEGLFQFEQKKPFLDFLRNNTNFVDIDVNNHFDNTVNNMMKKLQPFIAYYLVENGIDPTEKEKLFSKVESQFGFYEIKIDEVIEKAIKRNLINPKKTEDISVEDKIELIRPILFREGCDKIILKTFPNSKQESNCFEYFLCEINRFIVLTENMTLPSIQDIDSMAVKFYKKNVLVTFNPKDNDNDYKIKESLEMTRDMNIVYGLAQTGKTTMAKHLKEKFGFELLDLKELAEAVKKTKVDPENPDAEVEITFPDLLKSLKEYLDKLPLNKRVIVDNVFSQGAEPGLIDTYEKALEVIKTIGDFRNFYECDIDEKTIINNFKQKEGIAEELSDEQKATLYEGLEKPKKLIEEIRKLSSHNIKIKYGSTPMNSIKAFDDDNVYKFIIIKHEYDIIIEKTLELFAARNKNLYINVPKLIYTHFLNNDEEAKKLESAYGKKKLKISPKNPDDFEEKIYYKYNPIHFEKSLVNKLILDYISKNYRNIESAGNFVLLSGYMNYDLLEKPDIPLNLPLLEIKSAMELGEFTSFVQISREDIKQVEDEKAEQIIVEKPKKKKAKAEGLDGEGEEEDEKGKAEEPPEEEDPDGAKKFKPENFAWTSYDGNPRNYVQILKRLKGYPTTVIEASDKCREELIKVIGNHIDNYLWRGDSGYKGMITIIKVNGDIPEETDVSVNKVSRFIETRREANSMKSKGKSINDKSKAGGIIEVL